MDINIENLVPDEGTENVEGTTTEEIVEGAEEQENLEEQISTEEETKKLYTEEELNQRVDELLEKKIARRTAKIRKEYEDKYGELERVLTAGTGESDVSKITKSYKDFFESKGVTIPSHQEYSQRDIDVLAAAEAREIIDSGWDEVIAESNRLADKGTANMNARERAVFQKLATHRQITERNNELAKIGVTADEIDSKEFKEFASQFNSNTPITKVYDLYNKTKPKKEVKTIGSMKDTAPEDKGVKDFYTHEEASKFTRADYDNNPALFEAVKKSMIKW